MSAALVSETLTRSVEDYLKAIYRLAPGGYAATSDIAAQLEVAAPSVSGMLKRLAEQGLVEHVPYKGVRLTDEGRRVALRMVRRHRLIEAYLVACLGYTWDTVHPEAERLEHAVSDLLVDRMAAALGNPAVDPHGDPIPTPDGSIAEPAYTPLPDAVAGAPYAVARVEVADPARLRWLADAGLVPGAPVRLVERQPFNGPITLDVAGAPLVIGAELASAVLCTGGAA